MKRVLLVVALLGGLVFLTPSAALACSCIQSSTAAHVRQADTVFEGTLAWDSSNGVEATYGVNVVQVFKGTAASYEKLRSAPNAAACGLSSPVTNERYLFYVQGEHPGQMKVERCGGSEHSSDALIAAVTAATGASGTEPIPAPQATVAADDTGFGTFGWVLIGGAATVIAALSAIALRTRFR